MNPDIQALTASVGGELLADAIASVVSKVYGSMFNHQPTAGERVRTRTQRRKEQQHAETLTRSCEAAAAEIARQLGSTPKIGADHIQKMLVSPEVVSLIRQMFAAEVLGKEESLTSIRQRFDRIFQLSLPPAKEYQQLSRPLFSALTAAVHRSLSVEVELGSLAAHEALSAQRSRVLRDELEAVKKSVQQLRKHRRASVRRIIAFEERYREVVGVRHSSITPPHLNQAPKVPIDDLYVLPRFVASHVKKDGKSTQIGIDGLLAKADRIVVLGNPGGGKSTFATKLCFELTSKTESEWFGGRRVTPILIVLREYAADNKERKVSILEFCEAQANSSYQLAPPPGTFEYLLLNGRALVIFDGLDELLETSQRQRITSEVESFCKLYPSTPIVVTSREVGYEQAPLNSRLFDVFRLGPFYVDQVEDYAKKWFALDADGRSEASDAKAAAFMAESMSVPDLRANPLMLGLMCTIYREELYIPRNRPDVYRKCAEMMFDRWDRRRGIPIRFTFEGEFRPAIAFLAYWIYSDELLQAGVTEQQLIRKASEYLLSKRVEDRDEAEEIARNFVDFCRGRAWVFTNTGSTGSGDELYQFTHRTFLEYFTALYLSRIHETAEGLAKNLLPKIARREWDVVAQLAFQIKNIELEFASDRLLRTVVDEIGPTPGGHSRNRLTFAARCLEFLVPSSQLCRTLGNLCVTHAIRWVASHQNQRGAGTSEKSPAAELLEAIVMVAGENRAAVAGGMQDGIASIMKSGSTSEQKASLEVGLHVTTAFSHGRTGTPTPAGARDFFSAFEREVGDTWRDILIEHARGDFALASDAFIRGDIAIHDLVEWHGISSLSLMRPYSAYKGTLRVSLIHLIVQAVWSPSWEWFRPNGSTEGVLAWIGDKYLTDRHQLVFNSHTPAGTDWVFISMEESQNPIPPVIRGSSLFGLFYLFAVLIEAGGPAVVRANSGEATLPPKLLSLPFGHLLSERLGQHTRRAPDTMANEWTPEAGMVADAWAKGTVNFTTKKFRSRGTSKQYAEGS